jgi:hypothetical protein
MLPSSNNTLTNTGLSAQSSVIIKYGLAKGGPRLPLQVLVGSVGVPTSVPHSDLMPWMEDGVPRTMEREREHKLGNLCRLDGRRLVNSTQHNTHKGLVMGLRMRVVMG